MDQTIAEARARFSDIDAADMDALIDEAVTAVRRRRKPKAA